MHFQFLIEDQSGEIVIRHVMNRILEKNSSVTYDCKAFKGIGGFKAAGKPGDTKTNKLLNDLWMYLRGFDKSLKGIEAAIFVVLDNDRRETKTFRSQLNDLANSAQISTDHVFCIAVEEMEAWLLGDREALFAAYPLAREAAYRNYRQDSICGTWEVLADVVYRGGARALAKDSTYREIGKQKAQWADKIGRYLDLDRNVSPSFQEFVSELKRRAMVS